MKLQRFGIAFLAVIVAAVCLAPDAAEARTRRHKVQKVQPWHGWAGDSFYLDGVRYRGGNRRGPATAYNNWEGGFNPEAFWVLHLRTVSG